MGRGLECRGASGALVFDPDGAGATAPYRIDNQDFTVRALRGNAVLRWEYTPGSALFFVWSQQREAELAEPRSNIVSQTA